MKPQGLLDDISAMRKDLAAVVHGIQIIAGNLERAEIKAEQLEKQGAEDKRRSPLKLKVARIDAGFTQSQVAAALKVNIATIMRWEKENRVPKKRYFEALCALYGRGPDEFILG